MQQILAKAVVAASAATALAQWERMLPRAEVLQQSGRSSREAWGQAAEEFPEFGDGRINNVFTNGFDKLKTCIYDQVPTN